MAERFKGRSFLLHPGILMVEEPKTATEIARLIKERAYIQLSMAGRFATDHFQHHVRLEMRPEPGNPNFRRCKLSRRCVGDR